MFQHHRWHSEIARITGAIALQRDIPDDETIMKWASALLATAKSMREEIERRNPPKKKSK